MNSSLPARSATITQAAVPEDFDRPINRADSLSVKYDERKNVFGKADVIPLWVADMDFAAPPAITEALVARARHPIYGYTRFPDSLYEVVINWVQQRHGWSIPHEWIVFCPGVVPSLNVAVKAFTSVGDAVIIQPPVYPPFFSSVTNNGRTLLPNPLRLENDRYMIDIDHLTQCAQKSKLLLLCSPHNPVGRVWERQELGAMLQIAKKHDLVIISDEIHSDLIYPGHKHHVMSAVAESSSHVITALSPSKTFNIPGLNLSVLIIADQKLRTRMLQVFKAMHVNAANPFSIVAFEAAYQTGQPWLKALLHYLQGTREMVANYLDRHLPAIKLIQPQGTYLLWLDCRELNMSDAQLAAFFVDQAGVGMNPGRQFGTPEGCGFMRLNIGAPRKIILQALQQITKACHAIAH